MIIIKTTSTQISFPKSDTWAIYAQNEYYLDQNGDIAPDISSGFGPYEDVCVATGTKEYLFGGVYAGYEIAERAIRYINDHIYEPIIFVDLNLISENGPGYFQRGAFQIINRES